MYAFAWNSEGGYESLVRHSFRFFLPIFQNSLELEELKQHISEVAQIAEAGGANREIAASTAELFGWISRKDRTVSPVADMAVIGRWRSKVLSIAPK